MKRKKTRHPTTLQPNYTVITKEKVDESQSVRLNENLGLRYNNYQKEVNKPHEQEVKPIKPTDKSRRVGVVGVKLGMTSLWDDWGRMVGVTAI